MDSLPFNGADLSVAFILLISAILAYARGFVHEVLAVAAWIGASFVTIYALPYLQPLVRGLLWPEPGLLFELVPLEAVVDIATGVVVFVVTLVTLSAFSRAISRRIRQSTMNLLDRSLGFLFGVLRGALLVALAYIPLAWVWPPPDQPQWLNSARSRPLVVAGADLLKSLVSAEAAAEAAGAADDAKEATDFLRDLMAPVAKGPSPPAPGGYEAKDRQRLENLIDGSNRVIPKVPDNDP